MTGEHSKDSFVARIWLEAGSKGDTTWRGHLRHVQGDEEEYFQDLMEMREFLSRVTGVKGPALTAQPLKDVTKLEPTAGKKPGTVTNMKQKHQSEIPMSPKTQPIQTEVTKAQGGSKSLQPEVKSLQSGVMNLQSEPNWGSKVFYGVLIAVLLFFWWLLIYSGGVAGGH